MGMNNLSIKPFCVKYEDWMTDEQVDSVLKKAIECGAIERWVVRSLNEGISDTFDPDFWEYFGVDDVNETECHDSARSFGKDVILLELDQVDEHLGLAKPEPVAETAVQPKSLANVKLDCRKPDGSVDEKLSRAFQEACFEQGIYWYGEDEGVVGCLGVSEFLYTDGSGISWSGGFVVYFNEHPSPEIKFTYERKLVWDYEIIAKEEPAERKVIIIGGVEYYEDLIAPMLGAMEAARVNAQKEK